MLDQSMLDQRRRDVGEEMFPLIMSQFTAEIRDKTERLEQAHAQADLAELAELAHSLKSSTRTVGLSHLGDQANEIEAGARAGDASTLDLAPGFVAQCREGARQLDLLSQAQ